MSPDWNEIDHQRLKGREPSAFTKAYESFGGFVLYVAGAMGLEKNRSEDVVQEVFIRLWRHAPQLDEAHKLQAWLAITTRHAVYDVWRKQKRETPTDVVALTKGQEAESVRELPGLLQQQHVAEIVNSAVAKVEQETGFETLSAFYFRGMTVQEIAQREQQAVSTITTRLTRLRRRLKEVIMGQDGEKEL